MPELPEVETVRRGLHRALRGGRVSAVELFRPDLRWPMPRVRLAGLVGRRLIEVERRSKYLLLRFDREPAVTALVHLGMSGRLFVSAKKGRVAPTRLPHEWWRMHFGARVLRYVDPRRFGVLDVLRDDQAQRHRLLHQLGPEPFDRAFDGAFLFAATRGRKAAIKTFLMDGRNVVGVGNIYAAEALFRAGVRPTRAAGSVSRAACEAIVRAVQATLREAVVAGGTTIRDYIGVDRRSGRFQLELAVYGRAGQACPRCGHTIGRTVLGARATFFCRGCQR